MNIELEINPQERELTWGELRAFVALGRDEADDESVFVRHNEEGRHYPLVSLILVDLDDVALTSPRQGEVR